MSDKPFVAGECKIDARQKTLSLSCQIIINVEHEKRLPKRSAVLSPVLRLQLLLDALLARKLVLDERGLVFFFLQPLNENEVATDCIRDKNMYSITSRSSAFPFSPLSFSHDKRLLPPVHPSSSPEPHFFLPLGARPQLLLHDGRQQRPLCLVPRPDLVARLGRVRKELSALGDTGIALREEEPVDE
jgi:hypothetical protein